MNENKQLSEKVNKLLENTDITSYRIYNETKVPTSTIDRLRKGRRKVSNLTLETAEKLANYWDEIQ